MVEPGLDHLFGVLSVLWESDALYWINCVDEAHFFALPRAWFEPVKILVYLPTHLYFGLKAFAGVLISHEICSINIVAVLQLVARRTEVGWPERYVGIDLQAGLRLNRGMDCKGALAS